MLEAQIGREIEDGRALVARDVAYVDEDVEVAVVSAFAPRARSEELERPEPVSEPHVQRGLERVEERAFGGGEHRGRVARPVGCGVRRRGQNQTRIAVVTPMDWIFTSGEMELPVIDAEPPSGTSKNGPAMRPTCGIGSNTK